MRIMSKKFAIIAILLSALLVFNACQLGQNRGTEPSPAASQEANERFDEIADAIFKYDVTVDSLSLNYTLAHPENYGVTPPAPTLGIFTEEAIEESFEYYEDQLEALEEIYFQDLSHDRQLTYDVLHDSLEADLEGEDFIYYSEVLGPTVGIQAQLPILLAEYHFYSKDSIKEYLELLNDVPRYFDQIIAFEREKADKGLFMAEKTADSIIAQCEKFIASSEENYMISNFNNRVDAFEGLDETERADFKTLNHDRVLTSVVPAYEALIAALKELKPFSTVRGGLADYPKGKAYYEYLLKTSVGSSMSVKEADAQLTALLDECSDRISDALQRNPLIATLYQNPKYPAEAPAEILDYLKDAMAADYPALSTEVNFTVKSVDPSMEEDLSPAFYLTPPIDSFSENVIYVNNGMLGETGMSLFPTLAHEGFPGHLYQTVYYKEQSPEPIRDILYFGGYTEGWAVYVENDSYRLSGMDADLAELLAADALFALCLYAKADIGVNYDGWSQADVGAMLADYGLSSEGIAGEIYDSMVAEPCNYMKYTLGYIEFTLLREQAERALETDFSPKAFHEFILKSGPAPFDVLDKYLTYWLRSTASRPNDQAA